MSSPNRTLSELVAVIGRQLNDMDAEVLERVYIAQGKTFDPANFPDVLDHLRWAEEFITDTVNDGLRILAVIRPDLFSNLVKTKLKANCTAQEVPTECSQFHGIQYLVDCEGDSFPVRVNRDQFLAASALRENVCSVFGGKYKISSWLFDAKLPRIFYVEPTPPSDVDTYVVLSCVKSPPVYVWPDDKDVQVVVGANSALDLYEPWLIEFALYRAYIQDQESATSADRGKLHWSNGLRLLSEGKMADYTFQHPELFLLGPIKAGTGDVILRSE